MIDPAINLGNVLTIVVIATGAIGFIWALKGDARVLSQRLSSQDDILKEMKDEVRKIGDVLITLATQDMRLNTIEERQLDKSRRVDRLEERLTSLIEKGQK